MKISTRLMLLFLLVAVLPLTVFSYLNLRQDEITLREQALGAMSDLADKKATQVKSYLAERLLDMHFLARAPRVIEAMGQGQRALPNAAEEASLQRFFNSYVEETGVFYDVFLITAQGSVVYSQRKESDFATNLQDGPWRNSQLAEAFRAASSTLEPVISGYEYYEPSRAPALFIAAPVMVDGRFAGVFAVQLGTELFYKVATDATGLGTSGEVSFAQRDGDGVLYTAPLKHHPDAAMKFRIGWQRLKQTPMFGALSGDSGEGETSDYRGKQVVAAWRYLPELSWGMVVKMDADEVFAPIARQRALLLETLLGLLLFSGFLAYYFGRQISDPLKALAQTAGEVAKGRLDQRADESAPGEMGWFAKSFNRMTQHLQSLYQTLEERIEERTRELHVSNEQLQEEIIERTHIESNLVAANDELAVYKRFIDASSNSMGMAKLDGRLIYGNPALCELFGVSADQLQRHSIHEFYPENDLQRLQEKILPEVTERGGWRGELRMRDANGVVYDTLQDLHLLRDANGAPYALANVIVDITERKRAEMLLLRHKAAIQTVHDGFWIADSQGVLLEVNQAYAEMSGYRIDELQGMHISQLEARERSEAEVRAHIAKVIEKGYDVFETSHRHKDGHEIEIEVSTSFIPESEQFVVFCRDISERKRAEAALLNSERQYQRLAANIPVGVYLLHTTASGIFNFKYVSPRFCSMLGVAEEDVYRDSRVPFGPIHPDDLAEFQRLNQVAVQTGSPFLWEGRIVVENQVRWLRIESRAEFQPNGDCMWDGMITDITETRLARIELERNQSLLNEAQQLGQLGSWELDLVTGELRWSDEIYRLFELDRSQFAPSYEKFLSVIHPDDRDRVNSAYAQSLRDRQPYDIEHRLRMADGRIKWVREHCTSDFDESGKALRSIGAVQDITAQKLTEDSLRIAAVTFETHEGIMITDANGNILRVNKAFQEITGYGAEEVLGKNPRILSSGRHGKEFYEAMWLQLVNEGSWSGEIWDKRKNGQVYPKWLTITAVKEDTGNATAYVAIFSDITARKRAEEEIRNLAFYDSLTGLPNRRLLLDRFGLALALSARSGQCGSLLFLDMDKFKTLNDTMGHDYGDLMLIEVAHRIQGCVREADTVARLGGDEFVVLIEEISEQMQDASQKVALIAEKIRFTLAQPYRLKGHEFHSSPSIGVAMYRGADSPMDILMKHADMAMYQAKDAGRNAVRFFDPLMQQAVEARAELEADLRGALPNRQMQLYYQIQVDGANVPIGAEALLRWIHPRRGMVSPAKFIPIAEESSLVLEIGDWVIDSACAQLAKWSSDQRMSQLVLAVNVSARQFRMNDFVPQLESAIVRHGIDPGRLKLELTESVVLTNVADVVAKMRELKKLGIQMSLDDFGTGYSSLSYLKQLPLDQLKIDQSFIRDMSTDPNDAVMVQTIIDLAKNFRLNVIAEGVETEAQLAVLKNGGCMAYQGYLFSRPVPVDEFERLVMQEK